MIVDLVTYFMYKVYKLPHISPLYNMLNLYNKSLITLT